MSDGEDMEATLEELFAADQRVRELQGSLKAAYDAEEGPLLEVLKAAVSTATESDSEQASARLVRLALLLGELSSPAATDCLIDVLACGHPDARAEAGEQLLELSVEKFPTVREAVDRAITRLQSGSPALQELPFILAEIPEEAAFDLLAKLLSHDDPDTVATAIEVMAGLGDPSTTALLQPLLTDRRTCSLLDDLEPAEIITIGELAADAIELLSSDQGDEP